VTIRPTYSTIEKAHGRWREIMRALGVSEEILNGKQQPCPMCGGKDRFVWDNKTGDGNYICRQCSAGKGVQFLMMLRGWDWKTAAGEVDRVIGNLPPEPIGPTFYTSQAANPASLRRLYNASDAIRKDDPVDRYLTARGLVGPWPRALRYIPHLKFHPDQSLHPGMLAVFSDVNGKPATIHRTYLTDDGRKADIEPCRMFMPGKIPEGGAVRLAPVAETLGIAEGIENAIAAMRMFNVPVWAATTEGLMEKWQPPSEVKHVMIFADHDRNFVGQAAAYRLAANLMRKARDREFIVEVMIPPKSGSDWNDVLNHQQQGELQCEH
jgi:putative DNA primase/helicase